MSDAKLPRILCVDDEQRVLEGLERTLFDQFEVVATTRPEDALDQLRASAEPFAVLVSDMRMPGMDGAALLAAAREIVPETVRILLTGHTDLDAAVAAVNQGHIFRFLCKPCSADQLVQAISAAAEQHRLLITEREVLEQTLTGSIRLLSEILGLVAPQVFARSQRVRALVVHMLDHAGTKERWKFELAAALSLIGCVGLPEETLSRAIAGLPLDPEEKQAFTEHPLIAHRLLVGVPRFSEVAEMIRRQVRGQTGETTPDVEFGASLLRIARDVEQMVEAGHGIEEIIKKLSLRLNENERRLIASLRNFHGITLNASNVRNLRVTQLTGEMILEDDVRTTAGVVVVPKGRQLNMVLLERLLRFSRAGSLIEPLRVRVPYHAS